MLCFVQEGAIVVEGAASPSRRGDSEVEITSCQIFVKVEIQIHAS